MTSSQTLQATPTINIGLVDDDQEATKAEARAIAHRAIGMDERHQAAEVKLADRRSIILGGYVESYLQDLKDGKPLEGEATTDAEVAQTFDIRDILAAAASMPQHGHDDLFPDCPATLSADEIHQMEVLLVNDERRSDEELRAMTRGLLGEEQFCKIAAYAKAEDDKARAGFVCGCGCGCNRRYHHATSSYCPACRNGCCGE